MTNEEALLCLTYLGNKITGKELTQMTGCSRNTVQKICSMITNGERTLLEINNRDVAENFFSVINREDKSYFLGFFLSDGWVGYHGKLKTLTAELKLQLKDKYMVDSFANHINTPYAVEVRTSTHCVTGNTGKSAKATIRSQKIIMDMIDHGVGIGKCYREIPKLPRDMLGHFIRGMFDADGSFYYRMRANKTAYGHLELLSNEIVKNDLVHIVKDVIGMQHYSLSESNEDKNKNILFSITTSDMSDLVKFYNFVYGRCRGCKYGNGFYCNDVLCLWRKKERFDEYMAINGIVS